MQFGANDLILMTAFSMAIWILYEKQNLLVSKFLQNFYDHIYTDIMPAERSQKIVNHLKTSPYTSATLRRIKKLASPDADPLENLNIILDL